MPSEPTSRSCHLDSTMQVSSEGVECLLSSLMSRAVAAGLLQEHHEINKQVQKNGEVCGHSWFEDCETHEP